MVSGISLFDILQLLSMSRNSKVIEVRYPGGQGVIYIENGDIIHAEADGKSGEEAVYCCLSEEDVSFRELPWKAVARSINRTTSFLMLEAARLKDEKGIGINAGNAEIRPLEKPGRVMERKEELLISRIVQAKSVVSAILVRRNGEVMAGTGDNINSTRTLSSFVVGVGEQLKGLFSRERMDMIVVGLADDKKILILDLKSALLCVLIQKDGVVDLVKADIISILKSKG